ncbi:glycine-rich protein DC7.1-like [Nymphaea colorata]|nr:glycine-rich protein DC7.1-like [Nymphaea colorata]
MARSKLALPLVFAFLLFSQIFAADLEEKPDNKDANVEDAKYPYGPGQDPRGGPYGPGPYHGGGPYGGGPYGRGPPYCRFYCHGRCCSAEEFAALFQAADAGDLNADKHYGPYRPGIPPYRRPPYCHHYCGFRCCSAQEYAEFVQAGN